MGRFDALTQLDSKPARETSLIEKHANLQTGKPVNMQAGKEGNMQTGKHANMQTSLPVHLQAGLHANIQTGNTVKPAKYSSYLPSEYKKRLRRIAFETERHEYEVLQEAVELYFKKMDEKK